MPSRSFFVWEDGGAYISIVERVPVTRDVPQHINLPFGRKIQRKAKVTVTIEDKVFVTVSIVKNELVDTKVYDDNGEERGVKQVMDRTRVSGDDLTPELILEAANEALSRYHEITKSRAYLGDYPPKNLVTEY